MAVQIAFHNDCRTPKPIVNTVEIVFHACCRIAVIISQIPENTCLMASHAPDQFPVNTELIKLATPSSTVRNPLRNCPRLSHSPLNHASISEPQLFQNACIHLNTVSITVATALNIAFATVNNASHIDDSVSRIACQIASILSLVLSCEPLISSSVSPNSVAAS